LSFPYRLVDQMELPVLQVSNPAVNETRGTARGAAREIVALDQRHLEPAHRRVPGYPAAGDPASDHKQVEFFAP